MIKTSDLLIILCRYCLKIYNEADEKAKNVFLSLLRVYLRPKSGEPVMIEPAIRLLSRHGAHVDASKVSFFNFGMRYYSANLITAIN